MRYGSQRVEGLAATASHIKTVVFWTGMLSIVVSWTVVVAQNQWLQREVKKRL